MALVRKSVKQTFRPSSQILALMEDFRLMVNDCLRIGLQFERETNRVPSMKRLSLLSYSKIKRYGGYSKYRPSAISLASGMLSARRKSIKRGFPTRGPYVSKPLLVSCYGFKILAGELLIHTGAERFEPIPLNSHTVKIISSPGVSVRSFTLTERSLSLCISKDVQEVDGNRPTDIVGIDRNLRNLTAGNQNVVTYFDMTKAVEIAEATRLIVASFKRNDRRVRRRLASKYGRRRRERVTQIIHRVSKAIVSSAKAHRQAIAFEELTGIRKLYRRGNGQGRRYRHLMNAWPFQEMKRQVEYKARWEGVPVITLTRGETRGTTMDCPRCGERLQVSVWGDREHYRQLWCKVCRRWRDRDLVAVLNISRRGWLRFDHSSTEGGAREAVKGNAEHEEPLILRVDASKLRAGSGFPPDARQNLSKPKA